MTEERKDVRIRVPTATAKVRAIAPGGDAPTEKGSVLAFFQAMNHHCPFCEQTMPWEEFIAHIPACFEAHPEEVRRAREGK